MTRNRDFKTGKYT